MYLPAALPHTCMNLAAALPHIHELVSGIAAYTYTSSRVNVPSAATTVQVVALYIQKFVSASMGEELSGSQTTLNSRCSRDSRSELSRGCYVCGDRRRAPVAQRQRQSRQQVGQCLSRDEGRAALPHIMCFFTALPQILSLHCRFCLVANVFAEYCLLSFAASSRHCRFCVLFAFFGNKVFAFLATIVSLIAKIRST